MAELNSTAPRNPGDPGHRVEGQIETPMCPTNVDRKNTPGVNWFKGTWHDGSGGGKGDMKTDDSINGPSVKQDRKGKY